MIVDYHTLSLFCDTPGCSTQATFTGGDKSHAIRKAQERRWFIHNDRIVCPKCISEGRK